MTYKTKKRVVYTEEELYWIHAGKSGVYTKMLNKMVEQFEVMLFHHSKLFIMRFDLKPYKYTEKNTQITTFNRRLFKWLKRHYKLKRIGFMWCREQECVNKQHYHYVLMLDGHKVEKAGLIAQKVKSIWSELSGSYWLPQNCYYNVGRDNHLEKQSAIHRLSYLAKARGKKNRPAQTKAYGTSRIRI